MNPLTVVGQPRCEFCEAPLINRDRRTKFCDPKCRRAAGRAREAERARQELANLRAHGLSDTPGAVRMRQRRADGPITSDRRISFARAVVAGAGLVRQVARVSEKDAETLAIHAMSQALPPRKNRGVRRG